MTARVAAATVLLAALGLALVGADAAPTFSTTPWPLPSRTSLNLTMGYGTVSSTGTRFNWYVATLDDVERFRVALPNADCTSRATTTATAVARSCSLATNASPFSFTPAPGSGSYCLGQVVVDGHVTLWQDDGNAVFAVSAARRETYIGTMQRADVDRLNVTFAVSGFATLVSNGAVDVSGVAANVQRVTSEEIAPRTALAVDAAGRVLIVAVDGVEKLYLGLTLPEFSEVLTGGATGFPFRAAHAVNMDGGGSTTMSAVPLFVAGLPPQVYNRPTDTDTGVVSQREVTTVACVV